MTPRDVFGLIIRTFGLIGFGSWLYLFLMALAMGDASLFFLSFIISTVAGYLLKEASL